LEFIRVLPSWNWHKEAFQEFEEEEEPGVKKIEELSTQQCTVVADINDRLTTTDMVRKVGGCCAPFGGAVSPSNTMMSQASHTRSNMYKLQKTFLSVIL